jgi:hypothetical protein
MSETPDMDAPVSRREMHDAFGQFAGTIKQWLDSMESRLASKQELRDLEHRLVNRMDGLATKQELLDLERRLVNRLASKQELRELEVRLSDELRRQTKGTEDALTKKADDQYTDIIGRVSKLEAKVFGPSPKRRRRRRAR